MRYVFTGPAVVDGIHFPRKHLIALALEKGHEVENKVTLFTDRLVVGGRHDPVDDTMKVRLGLVYGVKEIGPKQFLTEMGYL